jgi:crotonobetainyl-CoA:carnitine CoA-transferase CaiB-like acyl-CoA transferase
VQVDLFSSLLAALVNQGSAFTVAGVVPARMGNAHPSISPYELYETGAGELVLAVGNDRQFAALCAVLDEPELAADPRFAGNRARIDNREALTRELVRRLGSRPAAEWAALLTDARVPAGVVNDIAGAFELARTLGLQPIVDVPGPDGSAVSLTRNPIGLSRTPPSYRSAPPALPD